MKKQTIIYLLLVLTTISCVDKYERNLKDVLGEWTLKEMSYTNESGEYVMFDNISSKIIFRDDKISKTTGNLDRKGLLVIEGDSIETVYQFSFGYNMINIEVEHSEIEYKPLYTFGKMQVNEYELIDKKRTLIFSNSFEKVYPSNEKLTNPVYVFER